MNSLTQLQHSRVKYEYSFCKASSSASSLLKVPNDDGDPEDNALLKIYLFILTSNVAAV